MRRRGLGFFWRGEGGGREGEGGMELGKRRVFLKMEKYVVVGFKGDDIFFPFFPPFPVPPLPLVFFPISVSHEQTIPKIPIPKNLIKNPNQVLCVSSLRLLGGRWLALSPTKKTKTIIIKIIKTIGKIGVLMKFDEI